MNQRRSAINVVLAIAVLVVGVPVAGRGQERGFNGQIYNDLVPFVGLKGVRLQIIGLEGGMFNVTDVIGDPRNGDRVESKAARGTGTAIPGRISARRFGLVAFRYCSPAAMQARFNRPCRSTSTGTA